MSNPTGTQNFITVKEAAAIIGVSKRAVQLWLKAGRFEGAYQIGDGLTMPWLIPLEEVNRVRDEYRRKK